MLSAFTDRFAATALSLTNHFPIVRTHLVKFSTLSASCTPQGHLNNRIQININTFQGVDELINTAPFKLLDSVINQTDLFHEAFDLPKEDLDARIEELFQNDALLITAVEHNWNELTNRHRAIKGIITQLNQAITHSEELHGTTISCMTHGVDLAAQSPGNLDGVESWDNAIRALDALLQESGTTLCAILHKCAVAAEAMQTCLSSLAIYPTIVQWRRIEFTRRRDEGYRNSRPWGST
jgi:hypothetical protein